MRITPEELARHWVEAHTELDFDEVPDDARARLIQSATDLLDFMAPRAPIVLDLPTVEDEARAAMNREIHRIAHAITQPPPRGGMIFGGPIV